MLPRAIATVQLRGLRGVTWEWREDAPEEAKAQPGRGVIAQEVEAVFPELVETDELGRKRVRYDGLVAPLCLAIAELLARVDALTPSAAMSGQPSGSARCGERAAEQVAEVGRGASGTQLDPQAVARVFPELVSTDEHGETVIAHHSLIGPLIEAVKELDARLTRLETHDAEART